MLLGGVCIQPVAWAEAGESEPVQIQGDFATRSQQKRASVVIANARIVDGTGRRIERGAIAVFGERIGILTEGSETPPADLLIIAFGTDTPPMLAYGEAVLSEIEMLGEVLNAEQIVGALTRDAARYLGLGEEFGTIEPGKIADIVLVNGDPLKDLADFGKIAMVIKNGALVVDKRD